MTPDPPEPTFKHRINKYQGPPTLPVPYSEEGVTPAREKFRAMAGYTGIQGESYFSKEYDKYGLVPNRGKPREYKNLPPVNLRLGKYGHLPWEGRLGNRLLEMYMTGQMRKVGYLFALGAAGYFVNYLSKVEKVPLPEEIAAIDNGTAVAFQARFYLPDFKLFNVLATQRDSYAKKWTASVFSSAFHYPERKLTGLYDVDYYCKPFHLHYRRKVVEGELFNHYVLTAKDRVRTVLKSEITGSVAYCYAAADEDGIATLKLSTVLPDDHWSVRWAKGTMCEGVVLPLAGAANSLWTRTWFTSSCNYYLRHHCSEVYVKPIDTGTVSSWFESI